MTTDCTEQVLEAMAVYAQRHARARMELSSTQRDQRELEGRWLREVEHLTELLDEAVDDGAVRDDLLAYLRDGETGQLGQLRDASEELAELRQRFTGPLAELARDHERAERSLEVPHQQVTGALQRWLMRLQSPEEGGPDAQEMGPILAAWRSATALTAREAGDELGISPSAVWRYEKGKRTPTLRTIEDLVAALSSTTGLKQHASEWRDALRNIAAMGPEFEELIYRSVDDPPDLSARERIVEGLDRLGTPELDALAELVDDPDALPALLRWAGEDPLGPVRAALVGGQDRKGGGS